MTNKKKKLLVVELVGLSYLIYIIGSIRTTMVYSMAKVRIVIDDNKVLEVRYNTEIGFSSEQKLCSEIIYSKGKPMWFRQLYYDISIEESHPRYYKENRRDEWINIWNIIRQLNLVSLYYPFPLRPRDHRRVNVVEVTSVARVP